jgi:hypothetical protein
MYTISDGSATCKFYGQNTNRKRSIFNKLKKQPIVEETINIISETITDVDEKHYIEQKSDPLPQVKREEIQRNKVTQPSPINEPVIPKTEIIKQLNEMNKKIDNLYEMIYKLTNFIEKNNNNTEVAEIIDTTN